MIPLREYRAHEPGVSLTADTTVVNEGDGPTDVAVTLVIDDPLLADKDFWVNVAGSGGPGRVDFAQVPDFIVVMPAQTTSVTAPFTLTPDDDAVIEMAEEVLIHAFPRNDRGSAQGWSYPPAIVTLTDNDVPSTGIALTVDPIEVDEGDGPTAVAVTATLNESVRAMRTNVVVGVAGSGDAAAVDFAPVSTFTIRIAAETLSGRARFTLSPEDDAVDEANETLTVSGTADLPVTGRGGPAEGRRRPVGEHRADGGPDRGGRGARARCR